MVVYFKIIKISSDYLVDLMILTDRRFNKKNEMGLVFVFLPYIMINFT